MLTEALKFRKFSVMRNLMLELTVGDEFRHWKAALKSYCEQVNLNLM